MTLSGRLDAVDGLRTIAMTLVIAEHCKLAPMGWTGVWLFYVISGFVIARTLVARPGNRPGDDYLSFIRRRFFRIVPLYLFYVALTILVVNFAGKLVDLRDVPSLLMFVYNWQMIFNIWPPDGLSAFAHLWTLSVEEQFYLLFPVLFLFLSRRNFKRAAILLVVAGPIIRLVFSKYVSGTQASPDPDWSAFAVYAASFTQFDAFLIGALIAVFEPEIRTKPRLRNALTLLAAVSMLAYCGAYAVVNHVRGATGIGLIRNIVSGTLYGQGREVFVYSAVDLACAALLVWALTGRRLGRVLEFPILVFIGRISYGGYIYHALVLWLLRTLAFPAGIENLPVVYRIQWFVIAYSITVSMAYVSFRWFEVPVIAWSRRSHRIVPQF